MPSLLMVEDNAMLRDVLGRRLRRRGFDVRTAEDGQRGLTMATEQAPELVLLDLDLPVIDGFEVARRLKADAATKHIPIIALTAHATTTDRALALEAGCDEFETKPVDMPRLLSKIEALLSGSG